MEIPITISVSENIHESAENLFGQGEKITSPEILNTLGNSNDTRRANSNVFINDDIVLGPPTNPPTRKASSSSPSDLWFEWNLALFIAEKSLNRGENGHIIADFLWDNTQAKRFKINFNNKEITNKIIFQHTVDEYLQKLKPI